MVPKLDVEGARKLLDQNGWVMGSDGVRVKDGQRASFLIYGSQTSEGRSTLEAIQSDLRKIGIEMRIQLWDGTAVWGKLATQEFDAFIMSYPYVSATDSFSLYFDSRNRPTPNRMNWNDPDTDRWLEQARTSTDPGTRQEAIAAAQRRIAENNVWLPLVRNQLWAVSAARVEGVRAHGTYGAALYKGLDIRLTR
jgi:peptide/nickel transport system substrate-binding protein